MGQVGSGERVVTTWVFVGRPVVCTDALVAWRSGRLGVVSLTRDDLGRDSILDNADAPVRLAADAAVDLHLHTYASDGAWAPSQLIDYLAEHNFRVVSVSDHDTQRSVDEATRLGAERGIVVIPGVEVTSRWADRQWHVLVYGIAPGREDAAAKPFQALLNDLDGELQSRAEDARRRFEDSGRALPALPEMHDDRPVWPFHVLSAVIKDGHARDLKEAAELTVELGGGFSADQPLERVVQTAHEAGGICIMAHPGRSDSVGVMTAADLDTMLKDIPLDGLEGHYRSYTDEQTALYRGLAADRGLLISCGSDSHAPGKPVDPRPWHAGWCGALLHRLGIDVESVAGMGRAWACGVDPNAVVPEPPKPEGETGDDQPAGSDPPREKMLDATETTSS